MTVRWNVWHFELCVVDWPLTSPHFTLQLLLMPRLYEAHAITNQTLIMEDEHYFFDYANNDGMHMLSSSWMLNWRYVSIINRLCMCHRLTHWRPQMRFVWQYFQWKHILFCHESLRLFQPHPKDKHKRQIRIVLKHSRFLLLAGKSGWSLQRRLACCSE